MKILVACEESQRVTKAFRERGHKAYSCDILETSGDNPEWHIRQDVTPLLKEKWDMIIAFPPCTYLSNAGACRLYPTKGILDMDRYNKGLEAKDFFMLFFNHSCDKIAIENPIQSKIFNIPKYDQIIQPWQFGHPYSKKTCLWLKGLPKLKPTEIITKNVVSWVGGGSKNNHGQARAHNGLHRNKAMRSKTFQGIADAMAEQWGRHMEKLTGDE